MIDPDTPDSVQADTPSGQDPAAGETGATGDDASRSVREAAPDPQSVKTAGDDSSAAKDPEQWVTGGEPMTAPQASYLATLAQEAGEQPPEGLTKSEASEAIDRLRQQAGR